MAYVEAESLWSVAEAVDRVPKGAVTYFFWSFFYSFYTYCNYLWKKTVALYDNLLSPEKNKEPLL